MDFRVLGELEVTDCGETLLIVGAKQRSLLALLLINAAEVVSRDRLCEELWDGSPPERAEKSLQMHVVRLRQALGGRDRAPLLTRGAGYVLDARPADIDVVRFETLVSDGQGALSADDPDAAGPLLAEALQLWRGAPLSEFADSHWARPEINRLEELHLQAQEARITVEMAFGRHDAVLDDLEMLIAREPLRERLRETQMLALYRCGRQADALAVYRATRQLLSDELGLEPGPVLRRAHQAILTQDPDLELRAPASATASPLPARLVRARAKDLVGRSDERAQFDAALASAHVGDRQAVVLAGEPGIGKTRLAAELAAHAHAGGATVLDGRCDEDVSRPYQPIVEALEQLVDRASSSLLREHVAVSGGELTRLVPRLAARVPDIPPPQPSDPGTERYLLLAAISEILSRASADRAVVLVLDDLQWADRPTLLVLRHLMATPDRLRLLLLATYRATELADGNELTGVLADLHRDAAVTRLDLTGLGEDDVAALVQANGGDVLGTDEPGFAARLCRETGGNPFFITEIVRGLLAQPTPGADALALPPSVQDTVRRRVARLDERAEAVLSAAAAIGAEFDVDLLTKVVDGDEQQLVVALDSAVAAMLIRPSSVPGRFTFVHALIEQTLYRDLGPARRRALHERIGTALESLAAVDARVAELARHWSRGADPRESAKPLDYTQRAGDRALAMLAPDDALRWYRKALELQTHRPDVDELRRCELLLGRGEAERLSGDREFHKTLAAAAQIARRHGDSERLVRAALANTRGFASVTGRPEPERMEALEAALDAVGTADHPDGSRLRATLATELALGHPPERRRALSDEAVAMARRLRDDRALAYALTSRFVAIWSPDTLAERRECIFEAVEAARRHGDPSIIAAATHWQFCVLLEHGETDEAEHALERREAEAQALRRPTMLWLATFDRTSIAVLRGRLEEAERLAGEAADYARGDRPAHEMPFYVAQLLNIRYDQGRLAEMAPAIAYAAAATPDIPGLRAHLALAHCEAGALDDAREILRAAAQRDFADVPVDMVWLNAMAVFAHVASRVDETSIADVLQRRLAPWADQMIFTGSSSIGCVAHYLGMLASMTGDFEAADAYFQRALSIHQRAGAPVYAARTRREHGAMLARRADTVGTSSAARVPPSPDRS